MRYDVFGKKLDGTEVKFSHDPLKLDDALYQVKFLTWMENRRSNKVHEYLYFYCLPIK